MYSGWWNESKAEHNLRHEKTRTGVFLSRFCSDLARHSSFKIDIKLFYYVKLNVELNKYLVCYSYKLKVSSTQKALSAINCTL